MTTAVLIPAYNGWEYLKKNLPHVLALGADEVIVVDDASTDGTSVNIAKKFPAVKLITLPENSRFPVAVNSGFAAASADIIYLLNQDVTPEKKLITASLSFFKSADVFAVSFNEQKNSYATAEFKNGFLEYGNGDRTSAPHRSFWASGGSAAFRKTDWDKLGGFDPIFTPGYYEDLDLGWRATRRGLRILWLPEAKVDHVRETAYKAAFSPEYLTRIKERNYLLCQWRNLSTANLSRHFSAIFFRCLHSPGFFVPFFQALMYLSQVITFRRREKPFIVKSDPQLFGETV